MNRIDFSSTALAATVFLAALGWGGGNTVAAVYDDIPSRIDLSNLSTPGGGKVCVIGTSLRQVATDTAPMVPAYYLTAGAGKRGVWKTVASGQTAVTALELGSDITSLNPGPVAGQPYINAASVRFYVIKKPSSQTCAGIRYTYKNTATGELNLAYYPYPFGLLEMSAYPKANLPAKGDTTNVLTIDTSNVDNFQVPLLMEFRKGASLQGGIGNPVVPAVASRMTMVSGANDRGGASSPFIAWLRGQPGYANGPKLFEPLALSSAGWNMSNPSSSTAGSNPFAMIEGPTEYLSYKCMQATGGWFVPAGCGLNGRLIHWSDPLASFYDGQLATFFRNAYPDSGAKTPPLVVMGDATAPIPQLPWKVVSKIADCPVYLKPDHSSLQFKSSYKDPIVICNPLRQVISLGAAPLSYVQSADVMGKVTTATLGISKTQYDLHRGKIGWNLGQPETGWIGNITKFYQQGGKYFIALNVVGTPTAPDRQRLCLVSAPSGDQPTCPKANPSFSIWVFTNLQRGSSVNPFETPTQMVFGNDGAFSSWLYYSDKALMTVAQSIERNIVWAFAHGVANCNNVTMTTAALRPPYCATVTRLLPGQYDTGAFGASDAYWSNERNWFPARGTQNYYAQYLHAARLDNTTGAVVAGATCGNACFGIFDTPNREISNGKAVKSNQGVPMGMAYGFGYDENPVYLSASPAQVPSKLDPIPPEWGSGVVVTIKIGRSW